ncbi:MAG: ribbon-helix-helix domain-containing protein, partial [Alphaproteobacteria bacterium]|nr:ribbon-helix-helix domain-containing protein [Alphaproteobacteria bacterium]
ILTTAAKSQNTSVASIISSIDNTRAPDTNLSSAVRVWILNWVISHK